MMSLYRLNHKNRNYTHPDKPRYASLNNIDAKGLPSDTIRVVSYNIKFSKKIDQAIKLFKKNPKLCHADIICLQEMDQDGVEKIAASLDYNYVYYPAVIHPRHGKNFGNAVLSKWPIVHDKKIILPQNKTKKLQRIAIQTTIKINNVKVYVYCVHLKVILKPIFRKHQTNQLIQTIPATAKYCIVAGDFNTFTKASHEAIRDSFTQADFSHATGQLGWSYKILNKKSLIDHIFVKNMKAINSGKIINRSPSDHLPIWTEMTLSPDSN